MSSQHVVNVKAKVTVQEQYVLLDSTLLVQTLDDSIEVSQSAWVSTSPNVSTLVNCVEQTFGSFVTNITSYCDSARSGFSRNTFYHGHFHVVFETQTSFVLRLDVPQVSSSTILSSNFYPSDLSHVRTRYVVVILDDDRRVIVESILSFQRSGHTVRSFFEFRTVNECSRSSRNSNNLTSSSIISYSESQTRYCSDDSFVASNTRVA